MQDSQNNRKSLKDTVLDVIGRRGVTMRPRWHFVLRSTLVIIGGIAALAALLYVVSLIVFLLRASGALYAPSFGYRGMRELLWSLPWLLVLLAGAFVIVLETLAKRHAFAYRQPLLYSALGIILLAAIGGFAVARTPIHHGFMPRLRAEGLGGRAFIMNIGGRRPHNIHRGTVAEVKDAGFLIDELRGGTVDVIVGSTTRFPHGTGIAVGDDVVVIGDRSGDAVAAFGVMPVKDEFVGKFARRHLGPKGARPTDVFRCGSSSR